MPAATIPHRAHKRTDLPFTVKAVVLDALGRVLILKDAKSDWQDLPGGHLRPGESIKEGLAREVMEETGLQLADIELLSCHKVVLRTGPCVVQLAKALALTLDVTLSSEHTSFQWLHPAEMGDVNLGVFLPLVLDVVSSPTVDLLLAVEREMTNREIQASQVLTEKDRFEAHRQAQAEAEEANRRAVRKALALAEVKVLEKKQDENGKKELLAVLLLLLGAGLATAYERAYRRLSEEAGVVHAPTQHEITQFVAQRQEQLAPFARRVVDELNLERTRGEEQSETPEEMARRLDEASVALEKSDGERVVKTEAQIIYGSAQLRLLHFAGFKTVAWATMDDERVRDSHRLCEAQGPVELGKPFQNGLRYPGDPSGPPEEIINCRCWLIGVERHK